MLKSFASALARPLNRRTFVAATAGLALGVASFT